ncbi:DUF5988 family protein [Saccharothrix sp. AJ9571]|nr:DUF5988 family protein [Saccharothrix sp. AJ9571]
MSDIGPNVVLRGGPLALPGGNPRFHRVPDEELPLKLVNGNRYEHFRPTTETELHAGRPLRVFEWIGRTYVAE